MKRSLLLTCLFAMILVGLSAQNFTVTPNPASASADLDNLNTNPEDLEAHAEIHNNTSDTLFLKWERIVNDKPETWNTAICDINLCYLPHVSNKEFTLLPDSTGEMLAHAYPALNPTQDALFQNGAEPGEATVKVKITNLNDPADTLIAEYTFVLTGSPILDIDEVELAALKVFPNPAADYFQLSETAEVDNLVVYNILGRQIRSFIVEPNKQYRVGDLAQGVYMVALNDRNNKTLKTIRILKR